MTFDAIIPWWDDTPTVVDLGHWLDGNGAFATTTDALDFREEPWKWDDEYNAWQREVRNEAQAA